MNITNVPLEKLVDEQGQPTNSWRDFFNLLVNQIQDKLSDEQYKLPQQSQALTNALGSTIKSHGAILFNTTNNGGNINIKTYPNGNPAAPSNVPPVYSYVPLVPFQIVADTTHRDYIPVAERKGKLVYVLSGPHLYIGVDDAGTWKEITIS